MKKRLSKREGLMLYWCEGDKYTSKGSYKIAVINSDPKMLKLFIDWLSKYYFISSKDIKLRLHLWCNSNERLAKLHWSKSLSMPITSFTKSWIKKISGKNQKYEYGLCRASIDSKKIFNKIIKGIESEFK